MTWQRGIVPVEEAFAAASVGFTDCKLHEWTPGCTFAAVPVPTEDQLAIGSEWYVIGIETPGRMTIIEFRRDEPEEQLEFAIRAALKAA